MNGVRFFRWLRDRKYRSYVKACRKRRWDYEINNFLWGLGCAVIVSLLFFAFVAWRF